MTTCPVNCSSLLAEVTICKYLITNQTSLLPCAKTRREQGGNPGYYAHIYQFFFPLLKYLFWLPANCNFNLNRYFSKVQQFVSCGQRNRLLVEEYVFQLLHL